MIKIMLMTLCLLATTLMMTSHPLSMGLTLLMSVITTSLLTGMLTQNFWFSYILFMVMVGGMMVLFIYMTSVASNEKFSISMKISSLMMSSAAIIIVLAFLESFLSYLNSTSLDSNQLTSKTEFSLILSKYVSFPNNSVTILMIVYLLMALIAVVKITNIKYGPLRQGT